jgi:hypothetical protein
LFDIAHSAARNACDEVGGIGGGDMLNKTSSGGAVDDALTAGDEEAVGAGVDTDTDADEEAEAGTNADADDIADLGGCVVAAEEDVLLAGGGGGAEWPVRASGSRRGGGR